MNNFDLKKYLSENKLNEENKGAMYQLIKLRDIENPYNLHRDLISSLNRFARATVAKEQGYQGFGLDNELQLTRLDVNNQAAFHKLDREEVKDTLKRALELYRSGLKEQDVKTKMTDFGPIDVPNTKKYIKRDITDVKPGDIITHDETGKEYEVQDLIGKAHRLQSNKLKVVDTEGNVRVINPYKYSIKESLNEGKAYKTVTDKDGNTFKPGRKYKTQYGTATFIKFSPDGKIIHLKSDKMGDVKTSVDNANKMEVISQQSNTKKLPSFVKDDQGHEKFFGNPNGYWSKKYYDKKGNEIYFENSDNTIIDNRP